MTLVECWLRVTFINCKINQKTQEKTHLIKILWQLNDKFAGLYPNVLWIAWRLLLCTLSTIGHSSPGRSLSPSLTYAERERERKQMQAGIFVVWGQANLTSHRWLVQFWWKYHNPSWHFYWLRKCYIGDWVNEGKISVNNFHRCYFCDRK